MTEYFTHLLLDMASMKQGTKLSGKPVSFYQDLLLQGVKKIECQGTDYTNFDEARFNRDLIYGFTFHHNNDTWVEEYDFVMTHDLNSNNKFLLFEETLNN